MFVITVIARAIVSPSVQAKRFGLAETHSAGWPSVIARAIRPTGLWGSPITTRARNSTKNKVATICSGMYCRVKYA
jgi:hypothetical protein